VLVQVSLVDSVYGIEVGDAERVTVGADWLTCMRTLCAGTSRRFSHSSTVASCAGAGIRIVFVGTMEPGAELTACPEAINGKMSKLSFIVANTGFLNIGLYLYWLELDFVGDVRRWIVSGYGFSQTEINVQLTTWVSHFCRNFCVRCPPVRVDQTGLVLLVLCAILDIVADGSRQSGLRRRGSPLARGPWPLMKRRPLKGLSVARLRQRSVPGRVAGSPARAQSRAPSQ
jgi:hypothetical protein